EYGHAIANNMPAIALVEKGVVWGAMHRDSERIELNRERPAEALLRLADTIAYWQRKAGRTLKLRLDLNGIAPEQIEKVRYRCLIRGREDPNWRDGSVVVEQGSACLYIQGVKSDDHIIEVEGSTYPPVRTFRSDGTAQVITVKVSVR